KESRRGLQNRVRPPQLTILQLEVSDPLRVRGRRSSPQTTIDLSGANPITHRLGMNAQLLSDPTDSPSTCRRIPARIQSHPHSPIPRLLRILPWCSHNSHPSV